MLTAVEFSKGLYKSSVAYPPVLLCWVTAGSWRTTRQLMSTVTQQELHDFFCAKAKSLIDALTVIKSYKWVEMKESVERPRKKQHASHEQQHGCN